MQYVHTNIAARDWRALAIFYQEVFGCVPVGPLRDQEGDWLARGIGVPGIRLEGVHLALPGRGDDGPTLEIYTYTPAEEAPTPAPNRYGLGHLAFRVDDVTATLDAVLAAGGGTLGSVSTAEVAGVGTLEFVYARDPEGNILELQSWR